MRGEGSSSESHNISPIYFTDMVQVLNVYIVDKFNHLHRGVTISPRAANNESSEVVDILLPVTFYFNPSTRFDNVKNI